jgi:head-tail adaptor
MSGMTEEFAGRLDERVQLERWVSVRDAAGDDVGGWAAVDTLFAAVLPDGQLTGTRAGDAARSARLWRVVLHWRDDIDLKVRLRWRGQILSVRAVAVPGQRRAFITLLCDGSPA